MRQQDALDRAFSELGVDPAYRPDVVEMLHTPPSQWRDCCGMLCTPCVADLARVVDRVRELMAQTR